MVIFIHDKKTDRIFIFVSIKKIYLTKKIKYNYNNKNKQYIKEILEYEGEYLYNKKYNGNI